MLPLTLHGDLWLRRGPRCYGCAICADIISPFGVRHKPWGVLDAAQTPPTLGGPVPSPVIDAALEAWAEAGRQTEVPIEGASMAPLLRSGDIAVVAHGCRTLRIGDVLAVRTGDRLVVHRMVGRTRDGELVTAGDNRPCLDDPVPAKAVVGYVTAVRSEGRDFRLGGWRARALGWGLAALVRLRRSRIGWRATRRVSCLVARRLRR